MGGLEGHRYPTLALLKPASPAELDNALNRLAEQFRTSGIASASADVPGFKPGTRLLREWQGQTFEVTVLDSGFAYRGTRYESLSKIAREITGARWSGPRFFGLKNGLSKNGLREPRHGR